MPHCPPRGAGVMLLGIDYVPALVDKARERAVLERLPARFEVGDCEAIPCADHAFDVVLSVLG
jgi:ubiquinone/menaquinone biosynthesis C-methylase UbiE